MIFQTVDLSDFRQAFRNYDRQDSFSHEALGMLFDMLEDQGEDYELDVIAICCDYNELDLDTINQEYGEEFETIEEAYEWFSDQTFVVGQTSKETIVFQVF